MRLHTETGPTSILSNDLDLPLRYEITNTGNTTDLDLEVRGASSSIIGMIPTIRGNENVSANSVLLPTTAVIQGVDFDGTYRQITSNKGGALNVSSFNEEVALGRVANFISVIKFGQNNDITTVSTPEDVWANGGTYSGQPTTGSPETVDAFSSDANDTSAGTGARTIQIEGLATSSSTAYTTENITLNGTTAVTSVGTWYRVNRATVLTAGSGAANAGTITVRHTTTTANVFAVIAIGVNQSTICAWTVPSGRRALLVGLDINLARTNGSNGAAIVSLRRRPTGGVYNSIIYSNVTNQYAVQPKLSVPIVFNAGDDIKVTVDSVSDNTTTCSAQLEIVHTAT